MNLVGLVFGDCMSVCSMEETRIRCQHLLEIV